MKISVLRTIFKKAFLNIFFISGGFTLFRYLNKNRLLILLYHGVLPNSLKGDDYLNYNFIVEEEFQWQMKYLKRHYRIFSLSEIVNRIEKNIPLPPYTAAITFDDGFQNNLTFAFPILNKMGIPATIFIATGFIGSRDKMLWTEKIGHYLKKTKEEHISIQLGNNIISFELKTEKDREQASNQILGYLKNIPKNSRRDLMNRFFSLKGFGEIENEIDERRYGFLNWEEVKWLSKNGIEIGSHTVNHEILSGLSTGAALKEMTESKKTIENHLGIPCELFSYPNGGKNDFSERDKTALMETGYRCAVSLIKEINPKHPDLMALRRINIGRRHDRAIFKATTSGLISFLKKSFSFSYR